MTAPIDVVLAALTALVALYTLAVRRTAGPAAVGSVLATLLVAGAATAVGESRRNVAGIALMAAGGAAVAWAMGRSRRRRRADRAALVAQRAGTAATVRFAALAERDRLAAELHDAAAHRLTGIVVSAAAALRLADLERTADALRHATEAGRQAVAELDRLVELGRVGAGAALTDIDALAAAHHADYQRTAIAAPSETTGVAYRVVQEALTNVARYACGAVARVRIGMGPGPGLVVTVADDGGAVAEPGLGTGQGLSGLRATVGAVGGALSYGPEGTGWAVRAELPLPISPPLAPRRWPRWRGPSALDWALVLLAIALSLGMSLLSTDIPDSFGDLRSAVSVVALSGLHAVPLGWRSRAPGRSLAVVLLALVLWLDCDMAGWTQPPVSDIFLVYWWVELTLVYSVGAYLPSRRGRLAPLAVAAVGGLALASGSGISGNRAGAWAVLTVMLMIPSFAVWSLGRLTARRRQRLRAATVRRWELLERDADAVVRNQRRLVASGLRRTAHLHARSVVAAADAGQLETVLAEARAALTALRELLAELRGRDDRDTPPPTVAGIAALAGRYGATVRYAGPHRPVLAVVEVAAYRIAGMLMAEGVTLAVHCFDEGVELCAPQPADPAVERRLRAVADATGGTLSKTDNGAVRVWLPEVLPSRSG